MHGHGADLDRERGALYSATAFYLGQRYISESDRKVRIEQRDFTIDVPPFEWVRESMTDPESLLLYLLQGDDVPFLPLPNPRGRRDRARRALGENWIHGQTMLEIREAVGAENFFLFGLAVEEVQSLRAGGYRPGEYAEADPELRGLAERLEVHSIVVAPVGDDHILTVDQCEKPRSWTSTERRFIQRFADQVHLQGYHLRSDCGLVLRTQSIFHVKSEDPVLA